MRLVILLIIFSAFVQNFYAQKNSFPNEIKGYRFFGAGKLKSLKLGTSAKDDVAKIFGKDCEDNCNYNKDWSIEFIYIEKDNCLTVFSERKKILCPADGFIGKLYSINLKPKKSISFADVSFAKFGGRGGGGTASHDGEGGGMNISFDSYSDDYGLSYRIFDRATFSTGGHRPSMRKGDLYSIQYDMPHELRDRIYNVEK